MSHSSHPVRFFTMPKPLGDTLAQTGDHQSSTLNGATGASTDTTKSSAPPKPDAKEEGGSVQASKPGVTFAHQDSLPKLPIPDLEATCRRYLDSLVPLQDSREHEETKAAVQEFLSIEGPELQEKLKNYASSKTSYIEEFCTGSLLSYFLRMRC